MRTNIPIFYNKHYYFDKIELKAEIEPVFNSKEDNSEIQNLKEELFYLYRSGCFERFCGLSAVNSDLTSALNSIKDCFGLSGRVNINLENYCSAVGICIDGLTCHRINQINNNQPGEIKTFTTPPFFLSVDLTQEDSITWLQNDVVRIDFCYEIHRSIHQCFDPVLEFHSGSALKHSYSSVDNKRIDLSQKGQKSISFEMPAIDILTQNSGYYLIKFGASDFAKIEFPRCGLPIGGGIYSFSELLDFCNNLNGNPSKELFSFYKLLKDGVISLWLQDNKEEGGWKKNITECVDRIQSEHQFKINDINAILEIVSGRTITFPMSEYVSIIISGISSGSIIGKRKVNNDVYYFVPWNSTIKGKLVIINTAKNRYDFGDIDFDIDFDIETDFGSLKTNVSCNQFGQGRNELDFEISVPENQSMGKYNVYIRQGIYMQKTNRYFVVTGEKIPIPISRDCSITMIGVYSLDHKPFYIAQTPLTQQQVQLLISKAKKENFEYDVLEEALRQAREHDGSEDNLPCTVFDYWKTSLQVQKILNNLNHRYEFKTPTADELGIALYDGLMSYVPYNPLQRAPNGQNIPSIDIVHSTKLGINNMLGNLLSITDTNNFFDGYIAYGTTYREPLNTIFRQISSEKIKYYIGYRPKMKIR